MAEQQAVQQQPQSQAPQAQPMPDQMNPFEAQSYIAKMLEAEEQQPQRQRDPQTGKFTKHEQSEATPATEAAPSEAEAAAPETKPEEQQPEIQPEPRRFKLKYKGEELEKDEPEVIELAQKGWDYTQKSQALAKEREELQAKVKSEQEAVRKQYEDQLGLYRTATLRLVDSEVLNTDLTKLALEDPAKAQQLFFKRQQIAETLSAIQAEQQKIAQQRQAEVQDGLQKQAKTAVERLQERIPGWNNDLYGKILKTAVSDYGFEQREVNAITDHRAIEVLHDALKWREYQAAKTKAGAKQVPPVAPKVQRPGAGEKADTGNDGLKKSMAKLTETGSRDSAVDVVRQMIEAGRL